MTRTETTARRSLRIQQAILEALAVYGDETAAGLARLATDLPSPVSGSVVSGHLRELHRDGLVERAEAPALDLGRVRTRWRLVEERCAGLLHSPVD